VRGSDPGPIAVAVWLFLSWNNHGWECNRLLSIGIGEGIGWVMLFNFWAVIWRIQKKIIHWTSDSAANGTPIPEQAKSLARQAFLASRATALLSVVILFFMGAAGQYPCSVSKDKQTESTFILGLCFVG
jgi:uncharacterized membrane protein